MSFSHLHKKKVLSLYKRLMRTSFDYFAFRNEYLLYQNFIRLVVMKKIFIIKKLFFFQFKKNKNETNPKISLDLLTEGEIIYQKYKHEEPFTCNFFKT